MATFNDKFVIITGAGSPPHIDPQHFVATNGRYVTEETIFLPLSDDDGPVNIVLDFSQSRDLGPAEQAKSAMRIV